MQVICTPKVRHLRYESLRRSLEQTILFWPHVYEHKVIGRNLPHFRDGLEEFENSFPRLNRKAETVSKNGTYISLTFQYPAEDVDDIISLWVASEQLKDCVAVM